MAVYRVEKTKNYTVMANHHLQNKAVTLKAKGLLSMMLSLPDAWDYSTRGLAAICKEGVDSIGAALKELEQAGYIVRNRLRDEKGRITDTEYVIYETPVHAPHPAIPDTDYPNTEKPDMDNPDTEVPDMALPDTEKPAQSNTDRSNMYSKSPNKSNTDAANPYPSNPYPSIPHSIPEYTGTARMRALVRLNVGYDCIATPYNRERLDEIVEIMVETLCSSGTSIRIGGKSYPVSLVKERLLRINSLHIEYIFTCLDKSSRQIHNIKQYLLATLFNATATKSNYYDAQVRHDQQEQEDWLDAIMDME